MNLGTGSLRTTLGRLLRRRRSLVRVLGIPLVLGWWVSSCGGPPTGNDAEEPRGPLVADNVFASYDTGEITREDFTRAYAKLPPAARSPGNDRVGWTKRIVQRIFADRILREELEESDFEEVPERIRVRRNLKRAVFSDHYLVVKHGFLPGVADDEIEAFYENHRDEFNQEEVRTVYHLMKRASSDEDFDRVEAELAELAGRVTRGENFGLLAEQYSESESRHRKGLIGTLRKGTLPPAADEAVFALAEGAVSAPVRVNDDVHLFFNENTVTGRELPLEEVRPMIQRVLQLSQLREALAEAAGKMEVVSDHVFPEDDRVIELIQKGDAESALFSVGTYEFRRGEFSQHVMARQNTEAFLPLVKDPVTALYEEIKNREIIFQHMLAARAENEEVYVDVDAQFREQWESRLLTAFQQDKLARYVGDREEILVEHHAANYNRFVSQPRVRLRRLVSVVGPDSPNVMAKLEAARGDLEAGKISLDQLAQNTGAEVEDLGWLTPLQLRFKDHNAVRAAFGMPVGAFSHPYRLRKRIVLFEVVEQEASQEIPLDGVRDRVIAHYLTNYRQKVFAAFVGEAMEAHGFSFHPENFTKR